MMDQGPSMSSSATDEAKMELAMAATAAERANREIELTDRKRQHLREGDEKHDAKGAQHHIEIELGEECGRKKRQGDEADQDRRGKRRPLTGEKAAGKGHELRPKLRRSM